MRTPTMPSAAPHQTSHMSAPRRSSSGSRSLGQGYTSRAALPPPCCPHMLVDPPITSPHQPQQHQPGHGQRVGFAAPAVGGSVPAKGFQTGQD